MSAAKNPRFIATESAIRVHSLHIAETGGMDGIRDLSLLQSALAQPEARFGGLFLHEGLYLMAAAYLFHVVKIHPFIDGNKRIGLALALTFLDVNGIPIRQPSDRLYDATIAVAENRLDKDGLAGLFEELAARHDTSGKTS